jgi:putative tryptophan/tyrosine transport system substrate-binding protein
LDAREVLAVRRRDFITLLGGATTAWPFTTRAQESPQVRLVGILDYRGADDPVATADVTAFKEAPSAAWME